MIEKSEILGSLAMVGMRVLVTPLEIALAEYEPAEETIGDDEALEEIEA